jgi:hypothetical protein
MRIVHFEKAGVPGIAADEGSGWHGLTERESSFPGTLPELIAQGADLLRTGRDLLPMHAIDLNAVRILPLERPSDAECEYRPAHFQRPRADRNDQRRDDSGAG